jgi:hypothetical protein
VLDDLLQQCRMYVSFAESMASPVKGIPMVVSMLLGQYEGLVVLGKRMRERSASTH